MARTLKESIRQINNMIGRIDHTTIIKEQEPSIASGPIAPSFEFPPELEDQSDDVKRAWFCMDDRENRGWNISEDTYERFRLLHAAIDGMQVLMKSWFGK